MFKFGSKSKDFSEVNDSIRLDSLSVSYKSRTITRTREEVNRNYRQKLCATWFLIVLIITTTWVVYIGTLSATIYAILISTFNVLPSKLDLSDNATFLDTYSSNLCPFNQSEALAKLQIYTNWFQSNQTGTNSIYANIIRNATCIQTFVNNNTQCTPECLSFAPGGDNYFIAWRVFVSSGAFISLVVSVIGIVTWIKIGGKLWEFPHIIFFYLICSVLVQSVCILSGQIVPQKFYCKHGSLIQSRTDTTVVCNIQGAIFHYSLMVFLYWYLLAVINLLYIISLPIAGATKFQKNKHWIHLFESIFCWGFPLIVAIATIAVERYQINNQPEFCHPSSIFAIVTLYLPGVVFCLFNGTAIPIVIGILLHRHFKVEKMIGRGNVSLDWVAQMAVFTVAFSIVIWLVMLDFTVKEIHEPKYDIYLAQYSKCVTIFGTNGTNCCSPVYRNYYNSALGVSSGFFSSIWGVAGLSALANKDVRDLWKKILTCNNCFRGNK